MIRCLLAAMLILPACSSAPAGDPPATDVSGPAASYQASHHDASRAFAALETLSSDAYEGRRTGEPGNLKAQAWIAGQLEALGIPAVYDSGYRAPFAAGRFDAPEREIRGTNLLARIEGQGRDDGPVIVMSAHYDHLGVYEGEIYNGADDNASGVAALLETAAWFQANPPENTIVFAFFDAEEQGFGGSAYFVRAMDERMKDRLAFNLNLDMVARADKGELYAVGSYHYPDLVPLIDTVAEDAPLDLKRGHDSPEWGEQDWSLQSDHAPFLRAGVPIIYLGVEDHPDYHQPSDTFDSIDAVTFSRSLDTVIMVADAVDDWVADNASK